jgi:hypothetical protein
VEHVALDLLVEDEHTRTGKTCPRAGVTTWLDRSEGTMAVRLSCTPVTAEATLAALERAVVLVNALLVS